MSKEELECVMCDVELEKDWADNPPHLQCYACNAAHESHMESMDLE